MTREHSIEKCTIQLTTGSKAGKKALPQYLSEQRDVLFSLINDVFNDFFPEDTSIEIKRLQIDLGTISSKSFSEVFHRRIKDALIKELEKQVYDHSDKVSKKTPDPNKDPFVILESFLEKGSSHFFQNEPDVFIQKLIQEDSERVSAIFKKYWHRTFARRRLNKAWPHFVKTWKYSDFLDQSETVFDPKEEEEEAVYSIITNFFETGKFTNSYPFLRKEDIDVCIAHLSEIQQKKLGLFFLSKLSQGDFLDTLSKYCCYENLYGCFEKIFFLAPAVQDWKQIEQLLEKASCILPYSCYSYRLLLLTYIKSYNSSYEVKASLFYHYWSKNKQWFSLQDIFLKLQESTEPFLSVELSEALEKLFLAIATEHSVSEQEVATILTHIKESVFQKNEPLNNSKEREQAFRDTFVKVKSAFGLSVELSEAFEKLFLASATEHPLSEQEAATILTHIREGIFQKNDTQYNSREREQVLRDTFVKIKSELGLSVELSEAFEKLFLAIATEHSVSEQEVATILTHIREGIIQKNDTLYNSKEREQAFRDTFVKIKSELGLSVELSEAFEKLFLAIATEHSVSEQEVATILTHIREGIIQKNDTLYNSKEREQAFRDTFVKVKSELGLSVELSEAFEKLFLAIATEHSVSKQEVATIATHIREGIFQKNDTLYNSREREQALRDTFVKIKSEFGLSVELIEALEKLFLAIATEHSVSEQEVATILTHIKESVFQKNAPLYNREEREQALRDTFVKIKSELGLSVELSEAFEKLFLAIATEHPLSEQEAATILTQIREGIIQKNEPLYNSREREQALRDTFVKVKSAFGLSVELSEAFEKLFLAIATEHSVSKQEVATIATHIREGIIQKNEPLYNSREQEQALRDTFVKIKDRWSSESVRWSMAYQASLSTILKFVSENWSNHYTYTWWLELFHELYPNGIIDNKSQENDIRDLYFQYFEFLAKDVGRKSKNEFQETISESTIKQIREQRVIFDSEPFVVNHRSEKFIFYYKKNRENFRSRKAVGFLLISDKKTEIEVQIFFEAIMEDPKLLKNILWKSALPENAWIQSLVVLTELQLERILCIILPNQMSFLYAVIAELRQNFETNSSYDISPRKVLLNTLVYLYRIKQEPSRQQLVEFLIHLWGIKNIEKKNILALEYEKKETDLKLLYNTIREQFLEPSESVTLTDRVFYTFLYDRYIGIYGFIKLYLEWIKFYVDYHKIDFSLIEEKLYIWIGIYLEHFPSEFSALNFVAGINQEISIHLTLKTEALNSQMSLFAEQVVQQGNTKWEPIVELLLQDPTGDREVISTNTNIAKEIRQRLIREGEEKQSAVFQGIFEEYILGGSIILFQSHPYISESTLLEYFNVYAQGYSESFSKIVVSTLKKNGWHKNGLQQDYEIQVFLIKYFSGARYDEFMSWSDELQTILRHSINTFEDLSPSVLDVLLYTLISQDVSTLGLRYFLQEVKKVITIPEQSGRYASDTKIGHLYRKIWEGEQSISPISLFKKLENNYAEKKILVSIKELSEFIENNTQEATQFLFDYILEKEDPFREIFSDQKVSFDFWKLFAQTLTQPLLHKALFVLYPSGYSYVKKALDELILYLKSDREIIEEKKTVRSLYAKLFQLIHDNKSFADNKWLLCQLLNDFYLPDNRRLKTLVYNWLSGTSTSENSIYPLLKQLWQEELFEVNFSVVPVPNNSPIEQPFSEKDTNFFGQSFGAEEDTISKGITLEGHFWDVLQKYYPDFFGFVRIYVEALQESSMNENIPFDRLKLEIYRYLQNEPKEFSAQRFVYTFNQFVARQCDEQKENIDMVLYEFTESKSNLGETRFEVLRELLKSQENIENEMSDIYRKDLSEDEYSYIQERLECDQQTIYFDKFKERLYSYLHQSEHSKPTQSDESLTDQEYLYHFLQKYRGQVFPLLKEIFQKETFIDRLFTSGDLLLEKMVLYELGGMRQTEFSDWHQEAVAFIHRIHPSIEKDKIEREAKKALVLLLLKKERSTVGIFSYLEFLFDWLKKNIQVDFSTEDVTSYETETNQPTLLIAALNQIEQRKSEKVRDDFLKRSNKRTEIDYPWKEGGMHVPHAGIVLTGPFLYRYFDRLSMLETYEEDASETKYRFKTFEDACRAVQLLYFLATGATEINEDELVLFKILCGVELDCLIEPILEITQEEKEVSESLLEGLLSNWSKLKSDSIESLREGFLTRGGILEQTSTGWNLEVERKAMDILVDMISWSFSLIKLSWMKQSLATKWAKTIGT